MTRSALSKAFEAAYLAGFIDGDGTVGSYRYKPTDGFETPVISATMKGPEVFQWLVEKLGGSYSLQMNRGAYTPGHYYYWKVTGARAIIAMWNTLPYLVLKREAAQVAIANYFLGMAKKESLGTRRRTRHWERQVQNMESLGWVIPDCGSSSLTLPHYREVRPAYVAGLLDTDGCIYTTYTKNKMPQTRISVTTMDKRLADWLIVNLTGSVQVHTTGGGWLWMLSGSAARLVLEKVKSHLLLKYSQADEALRCYELLGHRRSVASKERDGRIKLERLGW